MYRYFTVLLITFSFYFIVLKLLLSSMKKSAIFLLLGAAGIAYYFYSKAKAAGKLIYSFYNVRVGKLSGVRIPDIYIDFKITNPTTQVLSIDSVAGELMLNGKSFTTISNLTKTNFNPKTETIYEVKANTPTLNAAIALYYTIKNKQYKSATIGFKGVIVSNGIQIPIDVTKNIKDLI